MALPIGAWSWTRDILRRMSSQYSNPGNGSECDPYIVNWIENDTRNPHNLAAWKMWGITVVTSLVTLLSAMISSAYVGALDQVLKEFPVGSEMAALGISLFVLGFAVGPLLWAPLSELHGRQLVHALSFGGLSVFNAGAAAAQNIQTISKDTIRLAPFLCIMPSRIKLAGEVMISYIESVRSRWLNVNIRFL